MTAVRTAATITNSTAVEPTVLAASSRRPAPIYCPTSTVVPVASPVTMPVIVFMTWLPVDTADTAAVSQNCPTTSKSTAP